MPKRTIAFFSACHVFSSDHIDYIKTVAGIDHVGVGSDFDGIELYD